MFTEALCYCDRGLGDLITIFSFPFHVRVLQNTHKLMAYDS